MLLQGSKIHFQWRRIVSGDTHESDNRWIPYPISFNICFVTSAIAASDVSYSGTQWRIAGEMYATTLRVLNDGFGCYSKWSHMISIGN